MQTNYRALLAAAQRPGWKWSPWRGVLEHEGLHVFVSSWELEKRGVKNDEDVEAVLRDVEWQVRNQQRRA